MLSMADAAEVRVPADAVVVVGDDEDFELQIQFLGFNQDIKTTLTTSTRPKVPRSPPATLW